MDPIGPARRDLFGWIGAACLLLIIPIKLLRLSPEAAAATSIGIAPSVLGPPGLFFLLLSSKSERTRLTPLQSALITAAIAAGLELLQLVPRPGILARLSYTFDWMDLAASLLSLGGAWLVVGWMGAGNGRREPT